MRRVAMAALLFACRSAPDPAPAGTPGTPALIVDPTPQSRSALLQAVTDALGVKVTLADDALTRESTLLIERAQHRDGEGRPLQGREMGTAERFRLEIAGADCVLVHDRTGRRFTLVATRCAPAT